MIGHSSSKVLSVEGHVAEVGQGGGQLDEEVAGEAPHHDDDLDCCLSARTRLVMITLIIVSVGQLNQTAVITH